MKLNHIITLLCLIFCVSVTKAQKPIKVKKVTEKLMFSTVKYEVLKSDKKKKHGFYRAYENFTNQLYISGTYSFGMKEGKWEEWYQATEILKNEGEYKTDHKVGIWYYYDVDGNLLHEYDHDTKILLYSDECVKDKEYEVLINGESVWTKLDCPPSILGGMIFIIADIVRTYYDSRLKGQNVGGIVADISILIKKDGTVGDIRMNQSILNSEYIKIFEDKINSIKGEWLVGELDGEKVDAYVEYKSIISFNVRK